MSEIGIVARLIGGLLLTVVSVAVLLAMAVLALLVFHPRNALECVYNAVDICIAYARFVRAVVRKVTE